MSICAGIGQNTYDYELDANQNMIAIVESIEVIINCMLILRLSNNEEESKEEFKEPVSANSASRSKLSASGRQLSNSPTKPGASSARFNGLNMLHRGNTGDVDFDGGTGMEDSDEEEAKEVVTDILSGSPLPKMNKRDTLLKLNKANQENEAFNMN